MYCADGDICGYAIAKNISGMGNHTIYHREDAGMYLHLYGFQNQNSYGLPLGMELEPISGKYIVLCLNEWPVVSIHPILIINYIMTLVSLCRYCHNLCPTRQLHSRG